MNCVTFSRAFQDNMSALGLPAPNSLFSSLTAALAKLGAMLNAFKSVGPTATVAEMIGATVLKEKLDVIGVMAASYYVGAVIGGSMPFPVEIDRSTNVTVSAVVAGNGRHQGVVR